MIPLGTKDARGHVTLPLVGTWMVPRGMVKAIKGTKLFVEDVWLPRFKDVRFKGSLCRVLLKNVEVLRARLQDKAYIVEATQQAIIFCFLDCLSDYWHRTTRSALYAVFRLPSVS